MSTELQLAVNEFVEAFDQGDASRLASIYTPDFLNVHLAGEGGMAELTADQILTILQASRGTPHAAPSQDAVVHHAERAGDLGYVLMTRLKDLGNGWETVFYNLVWRRTTEKWQLFREFVWQSAYPAFSL